MTAVKRSVGRPPEGVRVDIRIPANLLKRIDRDAVRANVKRAEQIRQIIANHYTESPVARDYREGA